ncbi:MAG: hypothetical protein DIZ80_01915 [endosymbiont of Galathealinum brachiosum]|uniref:Spondin domain-containing protein n=1 Tax=endosymbiont of Galathealinum brachiosum TaxID=2200906 RepID=A0A370DNI5_9GAMM|nr:MAG: hypothetical protein DIZ80_01915 [endosymbiont of Galathealinum brachiosum]
MNKKLLLAMAVTAVSIGNASAQDLNITFTNLTHGNHFTPLIFSAHASDQHIFEINTSASASLQAMAEGGDISGLVSDLTAVTADINANPADGLMAPGQSVSLELSTQEINTHLSVAAMILPTNDGFVGLDSLAIPVEAGTYTYYLNGYDAGTEVNDEIVNGGGAPGAPGIPGDPLGQSGTGASGVANTENNTNIHIHRGVIGDTDATGGISDIDSRVHRWLNPVARLVVEVK